MPIDVDRWSLFRRTASEMEATQTTMTRAEAELHVQSYVFQIAQYQAVTAEDARRLLGDERFERLRRSAIRGLGPQADTFYPWNVADFVQFPDLEAK